MSDGGEATAAQSLPGHETGREKLQALHAARKLYDEQLLDEAARLRTKRLIKEMRASLIRVDIDYPIPAVRAWSLREEPSGPVMTSISASFTWHGVVAREDTLPTFENGRGFWAVKPTGLSILTDYHPAVLGMVELTGDSIIEHEFGWRADVCTVQELYILPPYHRHAKAIGELYQCDCFPIASFLSFLEIAFL